MEIIMQPGAELHGTLNKNHGYSIYCRNGRYFSKKHNNWRRCPYKGFLDFIRCLTRMAGGPIVADIIIFSAELNYALIMAGVKVLYFNYNALVLHAEDVRNFLEERNLL